MTEQTMSVMIVEDEEVAAKIYKQFTQKVDGFRIIATASNGKQALELLQVFTPDLILLDIFLPDMNGIDLLWEIRKRHRNIDIIAITAANDADTVAEAIRGGAFGYILKPIILDKFLSTLEQFSVSRSHLREGVILDQAEVDSFFHLTDQVGKDKKMENMDSGMLPKGIDKHTLKLVRDTLKEENGSVNADVVAKITGTSHSTARRYLEYLVSIHEMEIDIVYGTIGRPERRYRLVEGEAQAN